MFWWLKIRVPRGRSIRYSKAWGVFKKKGGFPLSPACRAAAQARRTQTGGNDREHIFLSFPRKWESILILDSRAGRE